MRRLVRTGLTVVGSLIALLILAIVAIYVWPLGSQALQRGPAHEAVSYARAVEMARAQIKADTDDPHVKSECRSILDEHGHRTAKSVLLLHGYTNCPAQFRRLATMMYDEGYNVYVPRAPDNGTRDPGDAAHVTAQGLVAYASTAAQIAGGLGRSSGVIGLSGGGVLATWAAYYRPQVVKRLLVLSPFYRPNSSKASGWELKPMIVLYGFGILPDKTGFGFSYHGLAQYLRIVRNYPDRSADQLNSAALVVSRGDDEIDKDVARKRMSELDPKTREFVPPKSWGLSHNIVTPQDLNGHAANLYRTYIGLYEGTGPR